MEPIKIEVSVELNLSENSKKFIADLLSIKPATQANAQETKSAVKSTQDKNTAPTPPAISIDDVRKALAAKVNDHRAEIKEKLEELGAPSVTKLDPAKYSDMLNFLNSLS